MHTQDLKQELIDLILQTDKVDVLQKLLRFLRQHQPVTVAPSRQAGWGKDLISYIAEDFDDTPEGFEEYMP